MMKRAMMMPAAAQVWLVVVMALGVLGGQAAAACADTLYVSTSGTSASSYNNWAKGVSVYTIRLTAEF